MLKQGTPVILVQANLQAVGGDHGTAEIFSFQGRDDRFIQVLSESGGLIEYAIGFIAIVQEVTDDIRNQIMEAREERQREARRKRSGIVTATIQPPKDVKH